MYNITDKAEVIREIKKYLYSISTTTRPEIGRTTIDGIYDKATEEIIRKYQRALGLVESGVVDYITFQNLAKEYQAIILNNTLRNTLVEPSGLPLYRGMANEDVRILNILITSLRETYNDLPYVGNGSYFSRSTEKAIHILREIFMMKDSDELDAELLDRMIMEIDAENRNRKYVDLKN